MQVMAGLCLRLIVNMPPRFGKSELMSRYLPACYLGTYPDRHVILASYQAEFAASWGGKARHVLQECRELYGVTIDKQADDWWTIADYEGSMQTAGAGGSMTGKGAHLLIIDDPIKNDKEAMSEVHRENVWNWFIATALSRLEPDGACVIIMTRWHEDDLTGRVQHMAKETGESWKHISLPALCEDPTLPVERWLRRAKGESLWPERWPTHKLLRKKAGSAFWFAGLYQQRPAPMEGGFVKRSWFRYFEVETHDGEPFLLLKKPDGLTRVRLKDCRIFLTVDLAVSTKQLADYTVISTWALTPSGDICWLKALGEKLEGPDHPGLIIKHYQEYQPVYIGIEATQYQLALVQSLLRLGLPCGKLKADKDKVSRFIPAAAFFQNGLVYQPQYAEWVADAETQLLHFPNAAHDDYVDTVSYMAKALVMLTGAGEMEIET